MEKIEFSGISFRQLIMEIQIIKSDVQTAKNLVNGKPIDSDRKLQGILTKLDRLLQSLVNKSTGNNELVTKNNSSC